MRDINFEHVFECDEDTFWDKVFFDDEYNRGLFLESLKFLQWKQAFEEKSDAVIRRTVDVQPPLGDVPGPIKKVLGDRFGYREHGTFDKKARRYRFEVTPTTGAEKSTIRGELWVEKAGDKKVRRHAKISVEVRIMMIGKLIEDRVVADMTLSYSKAADYTNAWVKKKGF
jgi:hypothetical protein